MDFEAVGGTVAVGGGVISFEMDREGLVDTLWVEVKVWDSLTEGDRVKDKERVSVSETERVPVPVRVRELVSD